MLPLARPLARPLASGRAENERRAVRCWPVLDCLRLCLRIPGVPAGQADIGASLEFPEVPCVGLGMIYCPKARTYGAHFRKLAMNLKPSCWLFSG